MDAVDAVQTFAIAILSINTILNSRHILNIITLIRKKD